MFLIFIYYFYYNINFSSWLFISFFIYIRPVSTKDMQHQHNEIQLYVSCKELQLTLQVLIRYILY